MPSGAGLTFTLLSLLLAWLLWQSRGAREGAQAEPLWRLRLRSLIPPLLLVACIPSGCTSERFDTLRLYARGMQVTEVQMQGGRRQALTAPGCDSYFGAADNPVFIVGRARGCVDLVVQDPNGPPAEGAVVRLDHPSGAEAMLRLATLAAGGGVLVAASEGPEGRSYAGAVPLNEGDQLCINRCSTAQARWWTFGSNSLTPASGGEARALRVRSGAFGWVRPYNPAERIHRLSNLLCDQPTGQESCDNPALADPARPGEQARPALSFLFQQGGVGGGGWHALLLDPGAVIKRADGQIVRPNLVQSVALAEGASRHVAILGLRGNSLRELRSFTLSHQLASDPSPRRTFRLTLDTPELVPIGHCSQPLSRLAVTPEQLSPEAFSLPSFGNRPNSVLASAAAGLPIEQFDLCRSTSFAFNAPLDPEAGRTVGGPELRQVMFDIDRMGIPWLLVILAGAVALVVHAASEKLWRTNTLDGLILVVAQYLLVVRAIVGIEGVFADPAIDWRTIYADIGTALVVLPMILVAARRREETSLTAIASLAGFGVAASAALWWWLGRPDAIATFLSLLALGALGLRGLTLMRSGSSAAESAEPRSQPAPARRRGFNFSPAVLLERSPSFWPVLLAAMVGVRIVLGLLGYRERIFGIALSAIYVPLLLIVVAAVLAQAEAAAPQRRRWLGILFLAALAIGAGLVAVIINDVGFALVHVPPIAGVALWRLIRWVRATPQQGEARTGRVARLLWAAPVGGLIALYLGLWALVALTPPPSEDAPLEERVAYAVADRSTDPNWLRLRAVFAPDQISRIGNRASAIQLDQSQLLDDLTGTIFGRGWLTPVDLGTFRFQATHLSDYLSASHLMFPFGRGGALALLLVLAAAAGAAASGRVRMPAEWPNLAGALAIWTLFGAAAYMVMANLLLVPFTGRNIYLLAASSGGDLMEGLILLLMARVGLGWRRAG